MFAVHADSTLAAPRNRTARVGRRVCLLLAELLGIGRRILGNNLQFTIAAIPDLVSDRSRQRHASFRGAAGILF